MSWSPELHRLMSMLDDDEKKLLNKVREQERSKGWNEGYDAGFQEGLDDERICI